MSQNAKILLGVGVAIVVLLALCLGGTLLAGSGLARVLQRGMDIQPEDAAVTAGRIADFDLPPGFAPGAASEVAGLRTATYEGDDGQSAIVLIQAPVLSNLSAEAMRRSLPLNMEGWDARSTAVGSHTVTINGAPVEVTVSEAEDEQGDRYRVASAVADLPTGATMILYERPLAAWDDEEMLAFFESIR
jgi:hypothetical protein